MRGLFGLLLFRSRPTPPRRAVRASTGACPPVKTPRILDRVQVNQRMDGQVPLALPFRDESGREVRLGDFFNHGRPVILVPVYYECPMLCTQVLNGLVTALGVVTLDPGPGSSTSSR